MTLPVKYQWLYTIGLLPRTVTAFLSIYGTKEVIGKANNPIIMNWAKVLKIDGFIADSIAWCGLTMAWVAYQAGYGEHIPKSPLWARNWKNFGYPTDIPMLGDILTFEREGGGGHTAIYIAEDKDCYHIGGGNQSDNTGFTRIKKDRLLSVSIPPYKTSFAKSRRQYFIDAAGEISTNEA